MAKQSTGKAREKDRSPARSGFAWGAALVMSAGLALTPARAQDAAAEGAATGQGESQASPKQLLEDYIHYVLIANYELSDAMARELLGLNFKPNDFAKLVEEVDLKRFESAAQRGMQAKPDDPAIDAEGIRQRAGQLMRLYETGKLDQARLPEVIAANIQALKGTLRGKMLARNGLIRAGEYAMPQLMEAFLQGEDAQLTAEVQNVLIDMGRQAVVPMTTALPNLPEVHQERVARVLGLIPYKSSLPALTDLLATTQSPAVRDAAQRALDRLGGLNSDAAASFRALAEDYYAEKPEVTSFPNEEHQLLWDYIPGAGLTMQAIRTPVFHEAMAMRLLERGMTIESQAGAINPESLALWVASNYSREADTPKGYVNPAYPTEGALASGQTPRRSAEYFGVASGPDVAQRVLARGLSSKDTPLARRALAAVQKTAGSKFLGGATGERSPLAAGLTYPSRRVQIESALAIAAAQPSTAFVGSERVVPVLAGAVRGVADQYAAVLSQDTERYQSLRSILEKQGFKVLPQGRTLGDMDAALSDLSVVDLVVAAGTQPMGVIPMIEEVRAGMRTAATPLLIITDPDTYTEQSRRFANDRTIAVRPAGIGETAIVNSVKELIENTTGGVITAAEADAYAAQSLAALRDLALAGNQTLRVADAEGPLAFALTDAKGERLGQIAEVLSRVPTEKAQKALMDAALASEGAARADLLDFVAGSARRFGGMLEERQIARVLEIARGAGEAEATAASTLLGALNIPNKDLLPLIKGAVSALGGSEEAAGGGQSVSTSK